MALPPPVAAGLAAAYLAAVLGLQLTGRFLANRPYEGSTFAYFQHVLTAATIGLATAAAIAPPARIGWPHAAAAILSSVLFYAAFHFYATPLTRADISHFQPVLNVAYLIEIAVGLFVFREAVTRFEVGGSVLIVLGAMLFLVEGRHVRGERLTRRALAAMGAVAILWVGSDTLARWVLEAHAPLDVLAYFFMGAPLLLALSLLSRQSAAARVARTLARRPRVLALLVAEALVAVFISYAYAVLMKSLGLVVFSAVLALSPLGLVLAVLALVPWRLGWLEQPTRAQRAVRLGGAALIALGLLAYALAAAA